MSQDTTAFSAALKNVYLDKIREQINNNTNLLDLFEERAASSYQWEGKALIHALHMSRNASGVKAVPENGGLPVAGKQGTANLTVPITFNYGRIQLSAPVMKASRSNKGAFQSAMSLEQKGIVEDMSRQRNRALALFGQGTLAVITTGVNSTTQTIKDPGNVTGTTNPGRYILAGMIVAIVDSTGVTVRGTATVVSVSGSALVLDTALNSTTGDLVQIGTDSLGTDEASFGAEAMGILGIVDSSTYRGTFFGLDTTTAANAAFRSSVFTSVGPISPDVLQRGTDNVWEISGEVIDQYVCHVSLRREILKLAEADRRYAAGDKPINPDAGTLAGGFKKDITFNGTGVRADKDFAYGVLAGLNTSHLLRYVEDNGSWADDDGTVLLRVSNTDAYEARYRLFENYGCDRRNCHVRFDGCSATITSGVFSN